MWLIVGLGNPGTKYQNNRHNIGFLVADYLIDAYKFKGPKSKFQAEIFDGKIQGEKALIIKPQTYMNNSGEAVRAIAHFYKIPPENIVVFYDELDLAVGKIKAKQGGGAAGHNGIKSLYAHCGKDMWKIRLGIGHPGEKHLVHSYVLGDFYKKDNDWLDALYKGIAKHIPLMLENDMDKAMSKINQDIMPALKDYYQDNQKGLS